MILWIKVPEIFVPEEKEFQFYCSIKLLKGNYINKEEAMRICGYNIESDRDVKKYDEIYRLFEKRYIKMCGKGYCDTDFWDYKDEEEK
jgi:hypothetical protein